MILDFKVLKGYNISKEFIDPVKNQTKKKRSSNKKSKFNIKKKKNLINAEYDTCFFNLACSGYTLLCKIVSVNNLF